MRMFESLADTSSTDPVVLQAVDRAIADLRRGAAVVLERGDGQAALVQAAETVDDHRLHWLAERSGKDPLLLLTARRAIALGLAGDTKNGSAAAIVGLELAGRPARRVIELADPTLERSGPVRRQNLVAAPAELDAAAVDLMKLARLLPAALLAPVELATNESAQAWALRHELMHVVTDQVCEYRSAAARSLTQVAEARVPLDQAENTRVVAFRPEDGGAEHLALIIGTPKTDSSVLVRLHSECFTGDLLGSLRCDCGEQLRGAIRTISEAGAGILLYLAQEGRGIGLVNKLRAYTLQDRGADTLEANETLGFDADERIYLPAAEMLRQLGFRQVRLLTNNPEKVAALTRCGISVEERVPHHFPSNDHNEFYLATKASRFGHLF